MQRFALTALLMSVAGAAPALAQPLPFFPINSGAAAPEPASVQRVAARQPEMGGGLFEALFGGPARSGPGPYYGRGEPVDPVRAETDPRYQKQIVDYDGRERPGTIIVNTRERFLYLVEGSGKAMRYGIGVGRPGFTWAGVKQISAKREWPDWRPPDEMMKRRPDLPRYMPGGPDNPLGARAMYLGSSLYRIHGSNEPWTIGTQVSSGCIRMRNQDVIDLYNRVKVGTKVIVI
jgi:lipoprotein-anchoring transpeptidase ErfK/SrfK